MISATPGIESLAKEAGAEDSIQKPFSVTLLLEKINQHISRAGYF
jgi:DNA-binding response OmpR family regulator